MSDQFAALRHAMVESQIRTTDVTSRPLIAALRDVGREHFVPNAKRHMAYIDEDVAVGELADGTMRYLMEPSPFAKLVQLADITPNDLVLDIGCVSGYSSAVLSRLCGAVIALEQDEALAARASQNLSDHGYDSVAVVTGTLAEGYASEGPYDVIFVGGSVDFVPDSLFEQLKPGGRLVAIVGRGSSAFATLYLRDDEGVLGHRKAFNLAAKPLPGFQKAAEFEF